MSFIENVRHEIICAFKAYESTVESLKVQPFIMTMLLSPMFYLLFFFMVRLQSIDTAQIPSILLQTLLIMPIGLCVFYVGTSFSKMKQWGVMRPLLLVDVSLFRMSIHMACVASALTFAISLFWFLFLEIVLVDFQLTLFTLSMFLLILLSSIVCASAFGVLCAVLILPMKERHLITNALFFFLIIFSGLMYQTDQGAVFWLSHLLPLTPFVSALKTLLNGDLNTMYLLIGYGNCVVYLVIAKLLIEKMLIKMQEGNTEF